MKIKEIQWTSQKFYSNKENKKIALSEKYIQAKVYLEQENKDEALKTLKELIFADDPTYATLSFFLLMNQNLVSDNKEMSVLFNRVISNNQFLYKIINRNFAVTLDHLKYIYSTYKKI